MKRMSQDVDSSSFPERGSFFLFRGRLGACRRASADGPSGVAHLLTALRPPPFPPSREPSPARATFGHCHIYGHLQIFKKNLKISIDFP